MTKWRREAFYSLAKGFWATRVANGLTAPDEVERRAQQQKTLIDEWFPGQR